MIVLNGVTKQYLYGARVLDALDMEIKDGEIIAVLGDEGSGKTTFVKVVSAVEDFEGEILLDGKPMVQKTDDTIVVFDDLALFENRTFRYNLSYPLAIRGYDKAEIQTRVEEAAEKLGVFACLNDKVKSSTLLDKKRLAVARLLLRDAKAVFVDDITNGLCASDAKILLSQLQPILFEFAKREASIVFATPNREEARAIADRIVVLHYGEVKQIGTFDEIYSCPQNIWAGEAVDEHFVFEEAKLESVNGKLQLVFADTNGEYAFDASRFDGAILNGYVGKNVYVGWHGEDYADDAERKEKVNYCLRLENAWLNVAESGKRVLSKEKMQEVCTLPKIDKCYLFDRQNENSILI